MNVSLWRSVFGVVISGDDKWSFSYFLWRRYRVLSWEEFSGLAWNVFWL